MCGEVIDVIDYGTIVQVLLECDDGRLESVMFDHRCYQQMMDSIETNIKGMKAEYRDGLFIPISEVEGQ